MYKTYYGAMLFAIFGVTAIVSNDLFDGNSVICLSGLVLFCNSGLISVVTRTH